MGTISRPKFKFGTAISRVFAFSLAVLLLAFIAGCDDSSSSSNFGGGGNNGGTGGTAPSEFAYALTSELPGANAALSAFALSTAGDLTPVGAPVIFANPSNGGTTQAVPILGGRFVLVTSGDSIVTYRVGTDGSLTQTSTAPAPDLGFQILPEPSGHFVYANRSAGIAGAIVTYSIDQNTGALTQLGPPVPQTLGLLLMDPLGRFLFVSNIGQVQAFRINTATGALTSTSITTGLNNDISAITPDGKFMFTGPAFPRGNGFQWTAYSIDPTTGALTLTGQEALFNDAGFAFHPTGRFLFVNDADGIQAVSIDPTTGTLTEVAGSPFPRGAMAGSSANGFLQLAVDNSGKFLLACDGTKVGVFTIDANGALAPFGTPIALNAVPSTAVGLFTIQPTP